MTARIRSLETAVRNRPADEVADLLTNEQLEAELVAAARAVKAMAGQINVLIHAAGVLVSLPYILEPEEIVESVSLALATPGAP